MNTKRLKLGTRLETVKSFLQGLPENGCIADIGSDHGKLVCAYLEEHRDSTAVATDISKASLSKARELAKTRECFDRISFRIGDGLSVVKPTEVDAICFCGMGGELIRDCLMKECFNNDILFVFQPMRGIEELREYLYENGFHIENDVVVEENNKYYQVFSGRIRKDKQVIPKAFPKGFWSIGYISFTKRDVGLLRYLTKRTPELTQQALSAGEAYGGKRLLEKLQCIEQILKEW